MGNTVSRRSVAWMGAGAGVLAGSLGLIGTARAQGSTESAFDRVTRTKTLRIAALPGELPYFQKDLASGEWRGSAFDAKLEYVESTYGNSVLDLQSNKIDLAFALAPTPQRALSIRFSIPFFTHPYGCVSRKGFEPRTWADLDKPEIRIACDLGSLHETAARRFAPHAQITAYKTRDEATLAFQGGRADALILAAMLGLSTVAKFPAMGPYRQITGPLVALPSSLGVRREADTRLVEVVDAWIAFNRGTGAVRDYLLDGLALTGVTRDMVPADLQL
jgi:polar amino acid transport system substrate-binding protein